MRLCVLAAAAALPTLAFAADPSLYSGIAGATVLDSGVFVVAKGANAREESFEYIRRPDGGIVLVNSTTARDGAYRVNGRFDYDSGWRATAAHGVGLHQGQPVVIALERRSETETEISVTGGGKPVSRTVTCDKACLMDIAPSITPMFAMTRHYDFARGGEQVFMWSGQDLIRPMSIADDTVRISLKEEPSVDRPSGGKLALRHFTFLESIPQPSGPPFQLAFDIWTDTEHRPLLFRVRPPAATAIGTVGVRKGYEDLEALVTN